MSSVCTQGMQNNNGRKKKTSRRQDDSKKFNLLKRRLKGVSIFPQERAAFRAQEDTAVLTTPQG